MSREFPLYSVHPTSFGLIAFRYDSETVETDKKGVENVTLHGRVIATSHETAMFSTGSGWNCNLTDLSYRKMCETEGEAIAEVTKFNEANRAALDLAHTLEDQLRDAKEAVAKAATEWRDS